MKMLARLGAVALACGVVVGACGGKSTDPRGGGGSGAAGGSGSGAAGGSGSGATGGSGSGATGGSGSGATGGSGSGATGGSGSGATGGSGSGATGGSGSGATGGSGSGATGGGGSGAVGGCWPTDPSCYAQGASGPGAACLATAVNAPDDVQLRVSQLQMQSPAVLSAPFFQDAIVTKKATPPEPSCFQNGDGQLNVLLDIKPSAQTLTMGAAPPVALAPTACFQNFSDGALTVAATTASTSVAGDGSFSASLPLVVLPVYLEDKLDQYMLWPLRHVRISGTLSADRECIGGFRGDALQPSNSCLPVQGEFAYENGGTLEGDILVTEADNVMIAPLGYSLCVLISGDVAKWKGQDGRCATAQGGALPQGDWCSATDSAAGCADAWKFKAGFAASATTIAGSCP